MPYSATEPVYLAALSPRDVKWDARRREVREFENLYRSYHPEYSQRLKQCSRQLSFAFDVDDNGVATLKLRAAHFCRVRLCPVCQERRTMKWQAKAFQAIPKVLEDYPKSRFIFLTLTVRNCHLLELRDTLRQMHRAWTKLVKRKEFSLVQGWMRNVEITRGADDTAHPHYHALLMVKPSYFSTGYVSQARWTELWQSCLGVDYTPIVDVRSVRARKGSQCVDMTSAILETVKYSVKPSDVTQNEPVSSRTMPDYEWLSVLTDQIHKTRGIATGGVLRKYLRDLECEPDDLVHIEEDGLSDSGADAPRVMFDWDDRPQRYRMQSEECGRV